MNVRLHKILYDKLPVSEHGKGRALPRPLKDNGGWGRVSKIKMIFGLRDTLDQREFADCVKGLEKLYEE